MDGVRVFNEALLGGGAAIGDATLRILDAGVSGIASLAGQTAREFGSSQGMARRLERDVRSLADTAAIVTATVPFGGTRHIRRRKDDQEGPEASQDAPQADNAPLGDIGPPKAPEPDLAGNINLSRINAPGDVKEAMGDIALIHQGFPEARRGLVSQSETADLARQMGMTPEELVSRRAGQAFNAEQAFAARQLLVATADDLTTKARAARGGSDADLVAFQEALTRHVAVQESVAGMTAEAGRALASFRMIAGGQDQAQVVSRMIQVSGGRERLEDVAERLASLDDPEQMARFARDAAKAKTSDMVLEAWINALLSGPQTHAVNMLSNTITALLAVPETATAAAIGRVRGTPDRVRFAEAPARLVGFVEGIKDGLRSGAYAYRTETGTDDLNKIENRAYQAIPSYTLREGAAPTRVGGVPVPFTGEVQLGGRQVRVPGRLLMASDELFKSIGYTQELNARAVRVALDEGLSGIPLARRVMEIKQNPTDEMVSAAREAARYQTFTRELGSLGSKVQDIARDYPAARVIIPFIRTPSNILKYTLERSPAAPLLSEVRDNLRGVKGEVARDSQAARILVGTGIGSMAASLAADGSITGGGPVDTRARSLMYASGWQPYSVRIGDTYYSYARLEPFGSLLGVAADMQSVSESADAGELDDIAAMVTGSVAKNLTSKTWLRGPTELIEAIQDPDRYGERYIQNLVGTVVPTGAAQVARIEDPMLRQADTILERIKSRVPGMSEDLLPRLDIWGEPIVRGGGVGPDIVSPIYTSKFEADPVNLELLRLGVWPAGVSKTVRGVELTPEQRTSYQRLAGRNAKGTLDRLLAGPEWQSLPDLARAEVVGRLISQSREMARMSLFTLYPEILQEAAQSEADRFQR
eukprot:s1_g2087.t1